MRRGFTLSRLESSWSFCQFVRVVLPPRYTPAAPIALQLLLLSLTLYKSLVMMEGSDTDGMGNSPSAMQQNSAQCT
jgi:hypothetical protein